MDLRLSPFSSSTSSAFQSLPSWELPILVQRDLSEMLSVLPPLTAIPMDGPQCLGASDHRLTAWLLLQQHKTGKFLVSVGGSDGARLGLCFYI